MLFTNHDAHRIACRQLGNDITLEVTKHLLACLFDQSFDGELARRYNRDAKACEHIRTHGDETRTYARRKDGGRRGKRAHGAGNYIPL